jgi:hypothetical protein
MQSGKWLISEETAACVFRENIKAACSCETSLYVYRTKRRHIAEGSVLQKNGALGE